MRQSKKKNYLNGELLFSSSFKESIDFSKRMRLRRLFSLDKRRSKSEIMACISKYKKTHHK